MKKKFLAGMLVLSLSIGMIACGNNDRHENASTNENSENTSNENTSDDLGEWGFSNAGITEEELNEIIAKKNKDVEMQINQNGYTEDELAEQILPTVVNFEVSTKDLKNGLISSFNGNIYDIQDDYIYIITCRHGFMTDETLETYNSENYGMNSAKVRFINNETITIPLNNISLCKTMDLGCVVIPTKDLSTETLDTIKSINISNMYKKNLLNETLSGYMRTDREWKEYHLIVNGIFEHCIKGEASNAENGCSGGGLFDNNGYYYGFFMAGNKTVSINYHSIIPLYIELINQINTNY